MRPRFLVALVLLLAPSTVRLDAGDTDGVPIPGDDFVVTRTVKIKPGTYRIADVNGDGVLHVKGDGTKLDLTGVTLIGAKDDALPDTFAGVGVSVDGAKDVTITGGAVRGFKIGVRVHDSPAATISHVDASGNFRQHLRSTVEREDESDWLFGHENDDGHWERDYGAGIALKNSPGATVEACVVRGGQNGVLLDRCDETRVLFGDYSFNSGWGVALWRTGGAAVSHVHADWCVRGYSHGRYARGQDSAGIFAFEQCSGNKFYESSATHCGDGFFLYAGNETLQRTGEGGCNENRVVMNDFSHAVANGIEATFSKSNVFTHNILEECDHGIWAGYSSNSKMAHNQIRNCANAVSIEHGHGNRISWNSIERCPVGVHLWWDEDADLAKSAFGKKNELMSHGNFIEANRFEWNTTDVLLDGDRASTLRWNNFVTAPTIVRKGDTSETTIDVVEKGPLRDANEERFDAGPGLEARLRRDALRGRKYILVDDWGPIPPTETRLFPATIDAIGAAKLSALGVDKKFEVTSLTDGFVAEPMTGEMPATIAIRSTGKAGPGAFPFEIVVRCGTDVRKARGTVASMPWDVRFFKWTKDPRDDSDAWEKLLVTEPVETRRVDGLDFDWKGGAVSEKVGADRFGTLATCEVVTAAGTWHLATVSDDGIRVWVDGALVVNDWTHHGPTPHDVDLDLAAGKHTIRVEHFEIDGWAVLRVSLAPVRR